MLKQTLQHKLLQKLSPQQIQFIKLLQVPTASLDARIKEELEENPALEDGSLANMNDQLEDYPDKDPDDYEKNGEDSFDEEFSLEEYIQEDDYKDYGSNFNNDDDDDHKEIPIAIQDSFFEKLQNQLDLLALTDKQYLISNQIISSLDDGGYLRRPLLSLIDDLAFSQNAITEEEEVEEMLGIIQEFEPAGIGARDLQECLLIQLRKKKDQDTIEVKRAIQVVENYLDEFTKKHYDKIEKQLGVNSEELKNVINEILKLNPKPGDSASAAGKQLHIIPDFHISNNDGVLHLTLNGRNAPELRVSRTYMEMFDHYEKTEKTDKKMKEAVQFVKSKLDSAKWFIDAIKQRQQTLLKTMNAIMKFQYEYFLTGDDRMLKPMILKDIAE